MCTCKVHVWSTCTVLATRNGMGYYMQYMCGVLGNVHMWYGGTGTRAVWGICVGHW